MGSGYDVGASQSLDSWHVMREAVFPFNPWEAGCGMMISGGGSKVPFPLGRLWCKDKGCGFRIQMSSHICVPSKALVANYAMTV